MPFDDLLDAPKLTSLQPLRILLVDDEPTTLQLVRRLLQADGHEIFEAIDGEQAIEQFERLRPDLVLLDVVIPKMDGLEVLREIRQRDKLSGVIMVSALSSEQLAVKSMLGGADDYVGKPFRLKAIRMSIRQVMDKVRLRRHNATLQTELIAANQKLRKYMAEPLVHSLLNSPKAPELGGEREVVTVLFLDFANFTPLAEQLPPDDVVRILNDYYALLTSIVTEAGGYLDKIMGDGFMVLFNAPVFSIDHATRAVQSAISMRRLIVEANHTRGTQAVGAHRLALGRSRGRQYRHLDPDELYGYRQHGEHGQTHRRNLRSRPDPHQRRHLCAAQMRRTGPRAHRHAATGQATVERSQHRHGSLRRRRSDHLRPSRLSLQGPTAQADRASGELTRTAPARSRA